MEVSVPDWGPYCLWGGALHIMVRQHFWVEVCGEQAAHTWCLDGKGKGQERGFRVPVDSSKHSGSQENSTYSLLLTLPYLLVAPYVKFFF